MKKLITKIMFTASLLLGSDVAFSGVGDFYTAKVVQVWADPSDAVALLDAVGPCGSSYFHVKRTSANFKEFYALLLTALATNREVTVLVSGCGSGSTVDRNIISQGNVH